MKTSDLMVRALEREGVEYVFGIPGEENLDLLESLRHSKIKLVLTRHEQAAGFMAATHGRLTGRAGVCLATLGPGATNFTTSAAYAKLGGMPVVILTGQKPIGSSKQGRFQILDVVQTMAPVTKSAHQIVDGNNVPHRIREAFRIAEGEKPGPVHLELPEDVATEDVDRQPFDVVEVDPPEASLRSLRKAAELIAAARRPLLCVAAGANRADTRQALSSFVDSTKIFFFTTQMGKGALDERHPQCLGTAALSDGDYVHEAIAQADLIINVGHDTTEKPPFLMHDDDGRQVVHLAYHAADIDDVYFPQHEVIGCTAANMRSLAALTKPSPTWDFEPFRRAKARIEEHVHGHSFDVDRFPLPPQLVVSEVRKAMPSDGILSLDNGMYKIWFARNYVAYEPNTVLLDNALATMGAGLPAAIGAKLVCPERKVVAICGDGGFMMNSQELESAKRLGLDLVVLILRDDAYGMIKWKQAAAGFENFGLDFANPDFVTGTRLKPGSRLSDVLARCFEVGGVHVVDVPLDYTENQKVLLDELRANAAASEGAA